MKRILELENPTARSLGLRTLSLLVTAQRPLSLGELLHALAVRPGVPYFDKYDLRDMEFILENTMGLITIDSDFGSVHMHLTLQQYLANSSDRWFPGAEVELTRICLTYLSYEGVLPTNEDEIDDKKHEYPLMAYAATFWGTHVHNVAMDPEVHAAALNLVSDQDRIAACVRVAWRVDRSMDSWDVRRGLHGIHVCAWFGLSNIIAAMNPKDFDVDLQEPTYDQTALMYACRKGHIEVVRKLMDMKAHLGIRSRRDRTAILEAVAQNNTDIVSLLLQETDLQLDNTYAQEYNRTELLVAADRGYSKMVATLLLDPRVNVDARDIYGRTAIWTAVSQPYQSVVSDILQKRPDANVNLADSMGGRTPLILAAMRNHTEIVELLLKHKANPELVDLDGGGTAILRAVEFGSDDALEILLAHNVDTKCRDGDGRSLLHGAGGQLSGEKLLLLIDHCEEDVNLPDNHGMTPLHEACQKDQAPKAHILLENRAKTDATDKYGRTPLEVAWQHDSGMVLSLLQDNYPHQANFQHGRG